MDTNETLTAAEEAERAKRFARRFDREFRKAIKPLSARVAVLERNDTTGDGPIRPPADPKIPPVDEEPIVGGWPDAVVWPEFSFEDDVSGAALLIWPLVKANWHDIFHGPYAGDLPLSDHERRFVVAGTFAHRDALLASGGTTTGLQIAVAGEQPVIDLLFAEWGTVRLEPILGTRPGSFYTAPHTSRLALAIIRQLRELGLLEGYESPPRFDTTSLDTPVRAQSFLGDLGGSLADELVGKLRGELEKILQELRDEAAETLEDFARKLRKKDAPAVKPQI